MTDLHEFDLPTDPVVTHEDRERFVVTNDSQATWAMRKLAALRARQAEIDAVARAEMERIEAWHLSASSALVPDANYFTALLTNYAAQQRAQQQRKSIALPHGVVKSRAGSARIEVTDESAFLAWAEDNAPTLIRVRREPDKAAIKAAFPPASSPGASEDGKVITEHGEIVPGVAVAMSEITYIVETN